MKPSRPSSKSFPASSPPLDEWGRKKLAYPIDYKTEGYYVLVDFAADPQLPRELERNFKNDESILRYMVTRKEA